MSRNYTVLLAVVLGAALVVGGIAAADLGSQPANAQSNSNTNGGGSTIHVSASGIAAAQPDKVVVRLAVEATAKNASTARERVAANVSSVRSALTDLGLSEDQIRTTDYNLYQDERRVQVPGKERPTEKQVYRVQHQLTVELQDVESAGSVIDTAIANGATGIHGIQFTLSAETRDELKSRALSEAMDNARNKATTLAESENLTIVSVERITTVNDGGYARFEDAALAATPTAGGASTEISSGPVTVSASVQVTYNATG